MGMSIDHVSQGPMDDLIQNAHNLAMLVLQSDRYDEDAEFRECVDNILEVTQGIIYGEPRSR